MVFRQFQGLFPMPVCASPSSEASAVSSADEQSNVSRVRDWNPPVVRLDASVAVHQVVPDQQPPY